MSSASDLTDLTIAAAAKGLAEGDFTSGDLTRAHLEAMEAARDLNAFVTETPDIALQRAEDSDIRRAIGESAGPLGNKGIEVAGSLHGLSYT